MTLHLFPTTPLSPVSEVLNNWC